VGNPFDIPFYPVNDFGPAMKGLVIGGLGIVHVFLAQFAIGGGILMCYLQWLGQTGRLAAAKQFVDDYFRVLVLVSFVLGALTGVGLWFTSIQISPRTIGMMVDEFHWLWAIEWTFFCTEVVAGYCFYRYGRRLPDRTRLFLLVIYSTASWASLFWINGILSWQLTPGAWVPGADNVWPGFFNPTFFPSLLFRTVTSLATAALVACVVINLARTLHRQQREELVQRVSHLLAPMILMPILGLWYFGNVPEDSRSWIMGGSPAMTLFLSLGVGASMLIGLYAFFGLIRNGLYVNGATSLLLLSLAFIATAGGEFVREGIRKPFTIREHLYANSLTPDEVTYLRAHGSASLDPYPLRDPELYPTDQVRLGARVFRIQCSICHTVHGANGLRELTATWSLDQKRLNIAQLQRTKPFMPPFAGTAHELEGLVQFLEWDASERPESWAGTDDPKIEAQIRDWIQAADVEPTEVADSSAHPRRR